MRRRKVATGRARSERATDGTLRVTDVADKGAGPLRHRGCCRRGHPDRADGLPGDILEEFEQVGRAIPAGAELDDVPVMQRLARRGALAGVVSEATFFDVGVPEGYREAVGSYPPAP